MDKVLEYIMDIEEQINKSCEGMMEKIMKSCTKEKKREFTEQKIDVKYFYIIGDKLYHQDK